MFICVLLEATCVPKNRLRLSAANCFLLLAARCQLYLPMLYAFPNSQLSCGLPPFGRVPGFAIRNPKLSSVLLVAA